jgi:agmatine deiminase
MPHPRTHFFDTLRTLTGSAKSMGYRMPAEWEPLKRLWLTFPHNDETWPGCLGRAMEQYRAWIAAMEPYVTVAMTQQIPAGTNDSWIRDYGPIFVIDGKGNKIAHDFHFNGWGGKYETRDLDDVIPQHIARFVGVPLIMHDLVLEGGSIDVNGKGTVMTTEQCLLNTNRNPHLSRESIVRELHEALGTSHVIWLPGGIIGDDTDGHIDDIARFVNADTVVGLRAPADHPDAEMLNKNWDALQSARDQDGKKLNLIELPVPEPIMYDFPADRFGPGGLNPVPASYANFIIANGGVFVPIFGQKSDDVALRTLERAMPKHRVIGLRADALVVGLGSFHCLSQQEPA